MRNRMATIWRTWCQRKAEPWRMNAKVWTLDIGGGWGGGEGER